MTPTFDEYIGIPFRENGRDRDGADCWGLPRLVYRDRLGIEMPSMLGTYCGRHDDRIPGLLAAGARQWREVEAPQPYDLVLFRQDGRLQHVGLVVGRGQFLHTAPHVGAVLERYTATDWWPLIHGFFRYPTL